MVDFFFFELFVLASSSVSVEVGVFIDVAEVKAVVGVSFTEMFLVFLVIGVVLVVLVVLVGEEAVVVDSDENLFVLLGVLASTVELVPVAPVVVVGEEIVFVIVTVAEMELPKATGRTVGDELLEAGLIGLLGNTSPLFIASYCCNRFSASLSLSKKELTAGLLVCLLNGGDSFEEVEDEVEGVGGVEREPKVDALAEI